MLNRGLIAKRRSQLGLSQHDLAQRTGLQYEHVEEYERIQGIEIDLREAIVLANALGVSLDRLASPDTATVSTTDAATVGALLSTIDRPVSLDSLSTALNWTADRLHAGLAELEERLHRTGQHLQTIDGHRYTILGDEAAADDRAVRHAREHELQSLSTTTARLLYAAIRAPWEARLRPPTPEQDQALVELRGLGLIAQDTGETITPTTDLLVELGLKAPSPSDHYIAD